MLYCHVGHPEFVLPAEETIEVLPLEKIKLLTPSSLLVICCIYFITGNVISTGMNCWLKSILEKVTANPAGASSGSHYDILTWYHYGYNYDCILSIITLFAQLRFISCFTGGQFILVSLQCETTKSKGQILIEYLPFKVLRELPLLNRVFLCVY